MFVRVLFLLLVALNLGAGAWLLFGREPARALPPATDPGVPELRLVSEVRGVMPTPRASASAATAASPPPSSAAATAPSPAESVASGRTASPAESVASAGTASPAPSPAQTSPSPARAEPSAAASAPAVPPAAPATAGTVAGETCARLGPFPTAAAQQAAIAALSPHVTRIRGGEQPVERSLGYMVYLPAAANHAAAVEATRALAAKGVHDYFVVGTGDMQNAVSLGVYDSAANAENRAAQLQKLGFGAKVKERVVTQPAYWADYAVPAGPAFDWKTWLPARSGITATPVACF